LFRISIFGFRIYLHAPCSVLRPDSIPTKTKTWRRGRWIYIKP
jgi:hypothetical protein